MHSTIQTFSLNRQINREAEEGLYTQFRFAFLQDPAHLGPRVRSRVQDIALIAFLAFYYETEFKNLRILEEGPERYIKALPNLKSVNLHIGISSRAFLDYGGDIVIPERESFLLKEVSRITSIFKHVQYFNLENHGDPVENCYKDRSTGTYHMGCKRRC